MQFVFRCIVNVVPPHASGLNVHLEIGVIIGLKKNK